MMSLEEKEIFCGHICAAAKSLLIGLKKIDMATGFRFEWNDFGFVVDCPSAATEKEALYQACVALQGRLSVPWNTQTRPDSDIHGPLTEP